MNKIEYVMSLVALMKIANNAGLEGMDRDRDDYESWTEDMGAAELNKFGQKDHDAMGSVIATLIGQKAYDQFSESFYDYDVLVELMRDQTCALDAVIAQDNGFSVIRIANTPEVIRDEVRWMKDNTEVSFNMSYVVSNRSLEIICRTGDVTAIMIDVMDHIKCWNEVL